MPLPETGDYEIEITSSETVNTNFSLYQFNDISGDIPTDQTPINAEIAYPGQNAHLNLEVSQTDQPTFLNISGSAINSFYVLVRSESGNIVEVEYSNTPNRTIKLDNLPGAGNYTVEFNPESDHVGQFAAASTLTASNTIEINGPALSLTLYGSQISQVTFSGNVGQRVFIKLNTGPFLSINVKIIKPNGETLDDGATDSRSSAININSLPETGTYRVLLDPLSPYGGDITISASSTATVGGNCYVDNKICFVKEVFAVADRFTELNLDVIEAAEPPPMPTFAKAKYAPNAKSSFSPIKVEFSMSEVNVEGQVIILDEEDNQVDVFDISETTETIVVGDPGLYRIRIIPATGQTGTFKFRVRNLSNPPPDSN